MESNHSQIQTRLLGSSHPNKDSEDLLRAWETKEGLAIMHLSIKCVVPMSVLGKVASEKVE